MRFSLTQLRNIIVIAALASLPLIAHAQPRPFGNTNIQSIIGLVIRNVLGLLGTVSLAVFVYGGFIWMTAQGEEKQVAKAKSTILYAVFGVIVAFLSYTIVNFVLTQLEVVVS